MTFSKIVTNLENPKIDFVIDGKKSLGFKLEKNPLDLKLLHINILNLQKNDGKFLKIIPSDFGYDGEKSLGFKLEKKSLGPKIISDKQIQV